MTKPYQEALEKDRSIEGEKAKAADPNYVGNNRKSNFEVNEASATTKALGLSFLIVGAVQSSYTIATSKDPVKETVTEGAGWAGAIWGGAQGAEYGTAIGGPWGGFVGGFVGGVGGFVLGKNGSEAAIEATKGAAKKNQENIKKIDDPNVLYMMAH
ncbi:MAG TPA: hypothetical protein VNT20_18390 [Flavisolibacter sp.]|jgi:hypothetical protein|nr:hypothetical protein [Flavisolibacter sp.]